MQNFLIQWIFLHLNGQKQYKWKRRRKGDDVDVSFPTSKVAQEAAHTAGQQSFHVKQMENPQIVNALEHGKIYPIKYRDFANKEIIRYWSGHKCWCENIKMGFEPTCMFNWAFG